MDHEAIADARRSALRAASAASTSNVPTLKDQWVQLAKAWLDRASALTGAPEEPPPGPSPDATDGKLTSH